MGTVVIVSPSPGGLLVGCMPPRTEAVPVVIVAPSVLVGCVLLRNGAVPVVVVAGGEDTPTVLEVVGVDTVERKTQNSTSYV